MKKTILAALIALASASSHAEVADVADLTASCRTLTVANSQTGVYRIMSRAFVAGAAQMRFRQEVADGRHMLALGNGEALDAVTLYCGRHPTDDVAKAVEWAVEDHAKQQ